MVRLKSLSFISPKQSDDRALLARGVGSLFLSVITALSFGVMGVLASKDAHAQNTTVSTAVTGSQACCTPTEKPNTNSTLTITNTGSITNTNTISGGIAAGTYNSTNTGTTINNSGTITGYYGVVSTGNQTAINNVTASSQINATSYAIYSQSGTVGAITNAGSISNTAAFNSAIQIQGGTISSLTNTGSITASGASSYGIQNNGTISILNNSQAGLTYTRTLPTNYNIIVNSASSFGTLSATSALGSTTFGITSSTLAAGTYLSVFSGLTSSNIVSSSLTGNYTGGYSYSLINASGTNNWNLVVTCPSCNSGGGTSGGGGSSDAGSSSSASTATVSSTTVSSPDGAASATVSTVTGSTSNVVVNQGAVTTGTNLSGTSSAASTISAAVVVISPGSVIAGSSAVTNYGTTEGIANAGIVAGTDYGVYNAPDATIINLTNNGIISGGIAGIANLSPNTIKLLVNNGMILGGIDNTQGRIITLINSQGGTVPLSLSGNLPNNYFVIVNGLRSYGQLAVTKSAGQMRFGIAPGSVVYSGLTYTSALTGVGTNNLLNTAGSGGGYLFKLTPETSGTDWNMTISASVVDTQSSLQSTTSALQNQYATQSNGVIAGLTYDCSLFGDNGICISAGGRQTGSSSFINGTTSALLIGAYKVNDRVRVGAYLDQNLSASNPNGIISNSNSTPMGGLFAVWNDRDDGLGTEVKASLGYNNKGMSITRPVVGTSEPGSGSTALTSQGANVVAKYNFGLDNRTTVSPYVGARYLSTVMNGYSEGQASNVLVPLAYSSLSMNATTALAGVGANHRLDEEITLSASAGMEADVQTSNGSYTVTNVNGLSPVALNPNPNKVRPTATAAAYYKLHKDAQIGLSILYRQDSMTGMSSTTGMVTYTMGM